MLNTGIILLSIAIDLLIKLLSVAEWINPLVNALILFIIAFGFNSRWLWQVLIPSSIILLLPKIKKHIQNLITEIESKSKLELLLAANSYTQHALLLKDHLLWLYREEIGFIIEILRGEMSLTLQIILIILISFSFGIFNLFGSFLKISTLHLLLKHSKFGSFYQNLFGDLIHFIHLDDFYRNLHEKKLPTPFVFEEDELKVEIVETLTTEAKIQFYAPSSSLIDKLQPINLDKIIELKPILDLFRDHRVSEWFSDENNKNYSRIWRWSKRLEFNYEESEWKIVTHIYKL